MKAVVVSATSGRRSYGDLQAGKTGKDEKEQKRERERKKAGKSYGGDNVLLLGSMARAEGFLCVKDAGDHLQSHKHALMCGNTEDSSTLEQGMIKQQFGCSLPLQEAS